MNLDPKYRCCLVHVYTLVCVDENFYILTWEAGNEWCSYFPWDIICCAVHNAMMSDSLLTVSRLIVQCCVVHYALMCGSLRTLLWGASCILLCGSLCTALRFITHRCAVLYALFCDPLCNAVRFYMLCSAVHCALMCGSFRTTLRFITQSCAVHYTHVPVLVFTGDRSVEWSLLYIRFHYRKLWCL